MTLFTESLENLFEKESNFHLHSTPWRRTRVMGGYFRLEKRREMDVAGQEGRVLKEFQVCIFNV